MSVEHIADPTFWLRDIRSDALDILQLECKIKKSLQIRVFWTFRKILAETSHINSLAASIRALVLKYPNGMTTVTWSAQRSPT